MYKELARLLFKVGALTTGMPELEKWFRGDPYATLKKSLIFSGGLAAWEGVVQPFDTWCTQKQTAKKMLMVRKAYVGATANMLRQFKTWMLFSYIEKHSSELLKNKTSIDPNSVTGVFAKSLFIGPAVAIICHPEYLLKTHLQIFSTISEQAAKTNQSLYKLCGRSIVDRQGKIGLTRGLVPRAAALSLQAFGALLLLMKGRMDLAKKEQASNKT